jgi:hypothetical protein
LKLGSTTIIKGAEKATLDEFKPGEKMFVQSDGTKAIVIVDSAAFEARRKEQKTQLRKRWTDEGITGGMGFVHQLSGEADYIVDHEAQRWGRFLKPGDKVELATTPPIPAVVKSVSPWRDRTQLRLVINGLNIVELESGQRLRLKMTPPPQEWDDSLFPPDLDQKRTRQERIDWFLASTYCTCGVANDTCTGHFYTLASCNPNGCGAPNAMRRYLGQKIDAGLTDKEIFEELYKKHGAKLLKPHLLP